MNIKKCYKLVLGAYAMSFCLTGCGNSAEKELATFSENISDFTSVVKDTDQRINAIDVSSDDASEELLNILDELNEEFKDLSELDIPEQYSGIKSLADEASEYMSNAVTYYHSAYDSGAFNSQDADTAYQYYTRAMTRVEYIGYILSGEIPKSENVTVYEEDGNSKIIDKLFKEKSDTESNTVTEEVIELP